MLYPKSGYENEKKESCQEEVFNINSPLLEKSINELTFDIIEEDRKISKDRRLEPEKLCTCACCLDFNMRMCYQETDNIHILISISFVCFLFLRNQIFDTNRQREFLCFAYTS